MTHSVVLLNDGTSVVLLNNGNQVLLNAEGITHGVDIVGTHPTPMVFRRGEQLLDVEFTFWINAALLIKTYTTFRAFACILRNVGSNVKVKSCLRRNVESSAKIKSGLLREQKSDKINIKSHTIPSKDLEKFKDKAKLKKVLLRKLREIMEDD